ncbi:SMI1/KNR4 family protein [Paenibacillus polygoni]|uniref:SMI1/KNR4 family protein n=1 Tax=Paenibacillus polygoni TaxID=3050112 RepID=A0ABY8X4A1_9BACL|nr:SMI1/KNR4 family protein [Paenibacillus polygoni]WIV20361.1 SMI1/KNR4 family protein [Paenibacillus polygoni]
MHELRERIPTRKPGVSLSDIAYTETKLQALFPAQYKELVQLVNQAEIDEWILYPIKDNQRLAKTSDDIIRNNELIDLSDFPERYIAIAEDGTGDLLCYAVGEQNQMSETIYYYDHESNEMEPIYENLASMIVELSEE